MSNASDYAALQVIHEAIAILATWAGTSFSSPRSQPIEAVQSFVELAKKILNWSDQAPAALQIVFDRIHLEHGSTLPCQYRPAWGLERQGDEQTPRIPYPQTLEQAKAGFERLQADIRQAIAYLNPDNLAQLTLFLEKFGSHLSIGDSDIALIDQARSTAAIAAALAQSPDQQLALVGGDLMGVQKFIYTISSEGALKSLRARSFYLELATEEVVQQLLTRLNLPRTNVIYAGASKFYLLVAATDGLEGILQQTQKEFNDWLLETFQRKVFLAIAHETFLAEDLKSTQPTEEPPLTQFWKDLNDKLTAQAYRKFEHQLDNLLNPQRSYSTPCKVCHRDDVPEDQLKPLSNFPGEQSILACKTCCTMFNLGDRLPEVKALVRSSRRYCEDDIQIQSVFYHPIEHFSWKPNPGEVVFQINHWGLKDYSSDQFVPMLLGNYFQKSSETGGFLSASEMAEASQGIQRVGYLRMDVDRLSQIFSKGLGQAYTLPRLACLSRQMTYFFKVYLNSLAACRAVNFTDYQNPDGTPKFATLDPLNPRKNLLFIYAGGDDLFVSGAWNEVVEFAFDVYQSFRAYTGWHPDITLSAGISITGAKFPLYQAADEAGDVEKAAKGNGRDSLGLLNTALKWDEWLGNWNLASLNLNDRKYLNSVVEPALFGVFPFIEHLYGEVGQGYTRSFVRNLLNTAQMQEEKIKEAKEKQPDQVRDIRYYLHLPKVAYTLARLPARMLENADFRQSLMSPYNAPYFRAIATWIELLNRNS
jgi:CRISPR-associated protein Csm1